jgi:hypothetical protein
LQVTVKPSFDEGLTRLRSQLDDLKAKMEALAKGLAVKMQASG